VNGFFFLIPNIPILFSNFQEIFFKNQLLAS
jgi:hypothetical protein